MTGGDLLVRALRDRGVDFIATVCGNGLDPILEACRVGGMRVVDARAEDAASYVAESYARLTGKLGVTTSSSGVAHINAMAGVLNSYYDGSPLLLITGETALPGTDRGKFQELDHTALVAPLCKYARRVTRTDEIEFYINEAIAHATSPRPGPVQLSIPADVTAAEVDEDALPVVERTPAAVRPSGDGDSKLIDKAARLLADSARPMIVAGSGAFYARAGDELLYLAGITGAPVATLIWDRGVLEKSDHCMGVVGAATGRPEVLPRADAIVLVGGQIDYRLGYGRAPEVANDAQLVRIDADPEEIHQGRAPDIGIVGNPRRILAQIARRYEELNGPNHSDWKTEAVQANNAFRKKWRIDPPPPSPPLTGRHLVDALGPFLTDDVTFLVDGGNIGQWAHQKYADRYPPNWITCGASGCVGWGIPGAMGAKLAFPDRPAILLIGDGAIHFAISDLESAVRQDLPFVVVVADDSAWGIVVTEQRETYGADSMIASLIGPVQYDLVAQGLGANGAVAETADEFNVEMDKALAADRPSLIQVPLAIKGPHE